MALGVVLSRPASDPVVEPVLAPNPTAVWPPEPPHATNRARADRQTGVMTRDATLMLGSLVSDEGDTHKRKCEAHATTPRTQMKGKMLISAALCADCALRRTG